MALRITLPPRPPFPPGSTATGGAGSIVTIRPVAAACADLAQDHRGMGQQRDSAAGAAGGHPVAEAGAVRHAVLPAARLARRPSLCSYRRYTGARPAARRRKRGRPRCRSARRYGHRCRRERGSAVVDQQVVSAQAGRRRGNGLARGACLRRCEHLRPGYGAEQRNGEQQDTGKRGAMAACARCGDHGHQVILCTKLSGASGKSPAQWAAELSLANGAEPRMPLDTELRRTCRLHHLAITQMGALSRMS